ncbi:MAG TPA: glucose 1-dehydrogenase [Thermoleophilia bacterium]|nr:glucose 1-dehydrogenase [Thermoleophilia bacterium]
MADREIWSVERIRNLFDLTGKTAVVTGGSGAFGHDAAKGLAAYGANVVVTSRRAENLEAAAKDIAEATGARVKAVACDCVDPESVENMVQAAVDEFGAVDILVTAAGQADRHAAEEFPIDAWQMVMDSLVKGTYLCCQAAGRQMIKQGGGKIITVGSVRGELGHPGGYSAYGTAKGAVHLLTKQLSTEWAKYQINVNSIAPCIFWTPLTQQVIEDPELKKIFLSRIPWGRVADPQDFIGAVVYLASPASDFVTGEIMAVDGGSTAG